MENKLKRGLVQFVLIIRGQQIETGISSSCFSNWSLIINRTYIAAHIGIASFFICPANHIMCHEVSPDHIISHEVSPNHIMSHEVSPNHIISHEVSPNI